MSISQQCILKIIFSEFKKKKIYQTDTYIAFFQTWYVISGQNTNPSCPSYSVLKSFPESTAVGVLVTLACTDADTPPDGTITYSIKTGNGLNLFGIDSTTGAISLISTIDYDDFITPHTHTVGTCILSYLKKQLST